MSQTTFDPTASSGSSDSSTEGRAQGSTPRRRPTRRSHTPKPTEGSQTTQATQAAPQAVAQEHEAPSAAAAIAEEQAGRNDNRRSRSRGGAKRPASRGKAGAQLIIAKPDEGQGHGESPAAEISESAEAAAPVAASEPTPEPVVVPVMSTGAEAETPAPVRKTRFGMPRRFQQPGATPASPTAFVAPVGEVSAPAVDTSAEAPTTPEPAAVEPTPEKPMPRYRFDRSRGAAAASITTARPERLASQRPGLYTEASNPTEEPVAAPVFDLPSLDALVGATDELPALAFDTPALVKVEPQTTEAAEEEEHLDEATEAPESAESGEGTAGASRRRRRRRRGSGAHAGSQDGEQDEALDEEPQTTPEPAFEPFEPVASFEPSEPAYAPRESRAPAAEPGRGRGGRMGYSSRITRRTPAAEPTWDNEPQQPTADASPYSSPEPSFARGFGPTPAGVATPVRESYPRPSRVERGADSGAVNTAQLGAVIREAIGTQTDRLLNELRRQQPPAVTLALPSAATTERVAVFVDVANVIYSARNLRTTVDFGHLLDFLRANRRLARAQAYAPTNPEPGAEQAFLSAVKGMGYRITTKNYKTFSNGAKKADLDLDLCMDIVRIVEAKAVDTIVLVSGDSDFLPLLDYCSDHGVRVEVAAFDDAASMILRQSCDLFVNLSLVDGIRG